MTGLPSASSASELCCPASASTARTVVRNPPSAAAGLVAVPVDANDRVSIVNDASMATLRRVRLEPALR
jgi:hypothetical protein